MEQWRQLLYWREELRDLSSRFYYHVRRFSLSVAQHLVAMRILRKTDDIFIMTIDDIYSLLHDYSLAENMKNRITIHRRYYNSFRKFNNPNEIGSRFTREKSKNEHHAKNVLQGVPCSPGVMTGKARVIKDIFDSDRLEPGDILITKYTDPAWSYKFGLISAVGTETGGLLSHTAVISREYGIPAVLAINDLLNNVRDGQLITVDGNVGIVNLNPEQNNSKYRQKQPTQ